MTDQRTTNRTVNRSTNKQRDHREVIHPMNQENREKLFIKLCLSFFKLHNNVISPDAYDRDAYENVIEHV